MSTQPVSAVTGAATAAGSGPAAGAVDPVRVRIVQLVLAAGSLAVVGFLLVRPGAPRGDRSYAAASAGRDAAWIGHLVESVGYGSAGVGVALAACLIARRRGAVWAAAGAVLVALGGLLYAATAYAVGVLDWYATATDAVPAPGGTALLAYVEDNPARLAVADVAGFVLFTVGSLLICVALWRSGAVPKALPIGISVLTLAQFVLPPNRALDVAQALLMVGFAALAPFAGRTSE